MSLQRNDNQSKEFRFPSTRWLLGCGGLALVSFVAGPIMIAILYPTAQPPDALVRWITIATFAPLVIVLLMIAAASFCFAFMSGPWDPAVADPTPLDKRLAADYRRERWQNRGCFIAFALMGTGSLALSILGSEGGKGRPLGTLEYCLLALSLAPLLVYGLIFRLWRYSEIDDIPTSCPTCGTDIGNVHTLHCPLEKCPFCGGQLVCCRCIHTELGLTGAESECLESYGDDSSDPLKSILARWEAALERKGRLPYGPRWFAAETTRDDVMEWPRLVDIKIADDDATAEFKTKDGRNLQVAFRRTKQGWVIDDE